MSGAALGWAKAQHAPSVIAKAVLVCLADYADAAGLAWPSVPNLAAEVQVSDRSVQRALKALSDAGLLVIEDRRRKDGGTTSNGYRLAMPPGDCLSPPGDTESPAPRQSVTPPVTLLSPANGPPIDKTTPDGVVSRPAKVSFDAWWSLYPSKVGKRAAQTSFDQAVKRLRAEGRDAEAVLTAGLRRSLASARWREPTYTIPNPTTWLNQDRWDDQEPASLSNVPPSLRPVEIADPVLRARHEALLRKTAA